MQPSAGAGKDTSKDAHQPLSAPLLDENGLESLLSKFHPDAPASAQTECIIQLSGHEQRQDYSKNTTLSEQLRPTLQRAFAEGASIKDYLAALRLLTAVYAVSPKQGHELLFGRDNLLQRIIWLSEKQEDETGSSSSSSGESSKPIRKLSALLTSLLICAAASHADSRKALNAIGEDKEAKNVKIQEVASTDTKISARTWLAAFVERAEIEDAQASSLLGMTALVSALSLHKLTRIASVKDETLHSAVSLAGSSKRESEDEGEIKKRDEEDQFLFEMCQRVISGSQQHSRDQNELQELAHDSTLKAKGELLVEIGRTIQASAVEGLTYLTVRGLYRDRIANSKEIMQGLASLAKDAGSKKDLKSRYGFPDRISISRHEQGHQMQIPNSALQYTIAVLFSAVMAYKASKSKEEEQLDKLRRMAAARDGAEETDPRLEVAATEARISRVVEMHGIETLVIIALSGISSLKNEASSYPVNPSVGVRRAVADALLSATTKQDKRQRGLIIQQGAAKALVALCNFQLSIAIQDSTSEAFVKEKDFASSQALAHLLITENPALVLADPTDAIPALCFLFLHRTASRLQRFEAALALTNIASLNQSLTKRIAECSFPVDIVCPMRSDDFVGAGRQDTQSQGARKVTIADSLFDRIIHEDNDMSRRACLELLCNLLMRDDVLRQWAGEIEDEKMASSKDEALYTQGRAAQALSVLALLCAPGGNESSNGEDAPESALKTRMAAGGAIAMLCGSPSACTRLLALEPRMLNRICKLIDPHCRIHEDQIVEITEENDTNEARQTDEGNDPERDAQDCASDIVGGPLQARWQLALRGLTAVDCLVQYLQWMQSNQQGGSTEAELTRYKAKIVEAGALDAVKQAAYNGAQILRGAQEQTLSLQTQAIVGEATKQALRILKACQSLGIAP